MITMKITKMKKLLTLLFVLFTTTIFAQTVTIDSTAVTIKHNELTFYLDADTNTYVSVQQITKDQIKNLVGPRTDYWHNEVPVGPYKQSAYVHTGYDLGHLTPCKITMYSQVPKGCPAAERSKYTNYNSFSMFNQAPQLAAFNEHPWEHLEMAVIDTILKAKTNAVIITGVIYNNKHKTYLPKSRIKIPIDYYKIVVLGNGKVMAWIGSNINGLITVSDVKTILGVAALNGDKLGIQIKK